MYRHALNAVAVGTDARVHVLDMETWMGKGNHFTTATILDRVHIRRLQKQQQQDLENELKKQWAS